MDRRGLAYDQAAVISYPIHAKWVAQMIQQKHRVPPPGYAAITWHQLHNADVELFTLAAQKARGGIRPLPSGAKPLDTLLSGLMEDSRVTYFLMPLPANTRAGGGNDNLAAIADKPAKRQKQETQMVLWTPPSDGKGKKGGQGKGKGKGGQRALPAPGGQPFYKKTKAGKSICPDFNSPNGCSAGVDSSGLQACPQGLHLCWAPTCKRRTTHGFCNHNQSNE